MIDSPRVRQAHDLFDLQPCTRCKPISVYTQVEAELKELSEEEASEYLQSLGAEEGGLSSLIAATYTQLGLRTYFTVGPKVCCRPCTRLLVGTSCVPIRMDAVTMSQVGW